MASAHPLLFLESEFFLKFIIPPLLLLALPLQSDSFLHLKKLLEALDLLEIVWRRWWW